MNDVKCECGHVNPHGTAFCEACGKILQEEETGSQVIDMRYEGSARRSQTYNKTIIDKVWNFFSSVKVGVWLILITLVASAIGTILPQEMYIPQTMPAEQYYQEQYGWFGKIYYQLGFNNLFSSWWYLLLMALIGVSLVICSLDRVIPLYKALKAQGVTRHKGFLNRQRLFGISTHVNEEDLIRVKENLKAKRYHVREENGDLLAEKNRFSRWGPYVNHIGLIIFLIGGMLRFIPGMYVDKVLWVREGETKVIPETNGEYFVKNNQFIKQDYSKNKDNKAFDATIDRVGMIPKNYQSNVTLYKAAKGTIIGEKPVLKKVEDFPIRVNHPLSFNGFSLYQVDYKLNELNTMSFTLINKQTNQPYGDLTINLFNPKDKYDLGNGYSVEVLSYFPDFEFSKSGEPTTKSRIPNNPAFVFRMKAPDQPKGESSFVAIKQTIEPFGNNEYKMKFKGIGTKNVSGLTVRKDSTIWVIILGGIIFMIGVIQGAYWNHRRIWIQRKDGETWVAAHTNKNWYGIIREMEAILGDTNITMPEDQLQTKKSE
ncbi:cytochrome c biogenesis protein ResB [Neobacillus sp. PS3-12]|jgi:cytochrome c biogenesis protein|uniref:cytochrome c biogenesis protein ResB n=1 Tax=Neobacillus sp. PS3-12 TaxID=3070677 RepID=UPI0027E0D81C|nr:cytochrome c biogenesis protein ResB [Neobacillus sp. PS3-12]WML53930.1 cytochrome c biogenesis protein ResB [Neobacillus sp. PS3-12]